MKECIRNVIAVRKSSSHKQINVTTQGAEISLAPGQLQALSEAYDEENKRALKNSPMFPQTFTENHFTFTLLDSEGSYAVYRRVKGRNANYEIRSFKAESQGRVRLESPANQAIVALSLLSAGASINSATLTSCSTSSTERSPQSASTLMTQRYDHAG